MLHHMQCGPGFPALNCQLAPLPCLLTAQDTHSTHILTLTSSLLEATMFKRLRDSEFSDRAEDIRGTTLYGSDNDKIGTIEDVLYEPDTNSARYAIVDSGGWLSTKRYLVPSD